MKISKASLQDFASIATIENNVFANDPFALSNTSIKYHLKHNIFFIAYKNDTALGYLLWLQRKEYFRLYSLAILPEHQNKRVASQLLTYSFEKLTCKKYFSLEVKQNNNKAIGLYEKFGFKIVKNLPNYYEDSDGFLMRRKA